MFLLSEEHNTNFSQLVMPFVDNMPEILIVQLICFVPSIETTGSENSQETRIIATFLVKEPETNKTTDHTRFQKACLTKTSK